MRGPHFNFAGSTALLFALALIFCQGILGQGILAGPSARPVRSGTFSDSFSLIYIQPSLLLTHGSRSMLAAAAAYQDAVQASPGSQAAPAPAAPGSATPAQPTKVELPEGDGKAIATEFCQDCHGLANLAKAHKSQDFWLETVQKMMDEGARLPQEDVDTLVKYLAKNFPPKEVAPAADAQIASPTAVPGPTAQAKKAELPEGDGKAIALENCQACHMLTNLTKAHKSLDDWRVSVQLMIDRGAIVRADQVETLIQYLARNFGPLPAGSAAAAPPAGAGTNSSSQSHGPTAAPAAP